MAILEFFLQILLLPFCLAGLFLIKLFEFLRETILWIGSVFFILYGTVNLLNLPPLLHDHSLTDATLNTTAYISYLFIGAGLVLLIGLIGVNLYRTFKPLSFLSSKGALK